MRSLVSICYFVFLVACDSESGVKTFNSPPEATITSHSDGDSLLEGYETTFRGLVTDDNDSYDTLVAQWNSGDEPLCDSLIPESDGLVQCTFTVTEEMTDIRLQVQDPQNAASITSVSIEVTPTEAPVVSIISPTEIDTYYSDQLILFSAQISDNEDPPEDLSVLWASNLDGELPFTAPAESSGQIEEYLSLSAGQHAISLEVQDTSGNITTETIAITVGGPNVSPQCEILAPQSSTVFTLGQNISFSGIAIDDDINNSSLIVRWNSSIDGVFDTTTPDTDGSLAFVVDTLSAGNHTIQLQVEDEIGELCQDSALITIGTPPSLSVVSPIDGDLFDLGAPISFEATISDAEDILSDIQISWESDLDGEFSTQGSDSNGQVSFSRSTLSSGLHGITVRAVDSSGLSDSSSLSLRVNSPPTAPLVTITPDPAVTTDSLFVNASGAYDEEGDFVSFTYNWTQDGLPSSYSSYVIPDTATAEGELWTVRVTPNDGYTNGMYTEASVVISNSLPNITSVSISPSTGVLNDSALTCSATSSDADELLTPVYDWTVGLLTYTGATLNLSTTSAMPNDIITCTASVLDSAGAGDSASASVAVINRDPTLSGVSIAPSIVYTDSIVDCSALTQDDDGETTLDTIDWTVNGLSIGVGNSLLLNNSLVSVGDVLECTYTASDAFGGSATASSDVVVANTQPVLNSIDLSPLNPTSVDTMLCSAIASDVDDNGLQLSFLWTNLTSGMSYTSTSNTVDSSSLDLTQVSTTPGDEIQCEATASDATGASDTQSLSRTVLNSSPTFDSPAAITPSTGVFTNTSLSCSASGIDPNDGALQPTYEWSVGGLSLVNGQNYTVDANETNVGDSIVCTATILDSDNETAVSTASVVVENTDPVVSNISISPSMGNYNDSVVSCSATVTDPDESLVLVYNWTIANMPSGSSSSLDLAVSSALPSDVVTCYATAIDSSGSSHTLSATTTLGNRDPSSPVVTISPSAPIEGVNTLVCSGSGSVDPDGQTINYSYEWTSSTGMTISGSTVGSNLTFQGDVWTCTVTASDTVLETSNSASVVIEPDGILGTARMINGTWIDISYELCASGPSCTASAAKQACTSVGKKVVSHASNGTSEVFNLGASASCQWSISYYTVNQSMPSNSCLVGVSNLDWSGCCTTSRWHGNTVAFGTANSVFGYVNSGNSGYSSSYSNTAGTQWGCNDLSTPGGAYGSCSDYYVACTSN